MVMGDIVQEAELLVIGSGPGGYAAAFRAADLGLDVTMVDLAPKPGGVCLFRGCIPSKTYLYLAELLYDAQRAERMGISFGPPKIDLKAIRAWKQQVLDRLSNGLMTLSHKRGVQLVTGRAVFEGPDTVRLLESEVSRIKFKHAVVATGSRAMRLPGEASDPSGRIMTSGGALALADIPKRLLVVGGGYVGLELGSVYAALGSEVTLVERDGQLLPGVDPDLVKPLRRRLDQSFKQILLNSELKRTVVGDGDVAVTITDGKHRPITQSVERVLVAVGRQPNTNGLGLKAAGVAVDDREFIRVDEQMRTTNPHIFAIGDVVGGAMLAHKATREGKVAAEVIVGQPSAFDVRAVPAVVFTDPQIAWCGLTEAQALRDQIPVTVQRFPWKYSGRAATLGTDEGFTKIIADPKTKRILGVAVVGRDTEGLIAEGVLAVEMGALVEDVALSMHPHPTLSETEGEAAELFTGSSTHILPVKFGPA